MRTLYRSVQLKRLHMIYLWFLSLSSSEHYTMNHGLLPEEVFLVMCQSGVSHFLKKIICKYSLWQPWNEKMAEVLTLSTDTSSCLN